MKRKIDRVLRRFSRKRENLIPILQQIQKRLGYLPPEAMQEVAEHPVHS